MPRLYQPTSGPQRTKTQFGGLFKGIAGSHWSLMAGPGRLQRTDSYSQCACVRESRKVGLYKGELSAFQT